MPQREDEQQIVFVKPASSTARGDLGCFLLLMDRSRYRPSAPRPRLSRDRDMNVFATGQFHCAITDDASTSLLLFRRHGKASRARLIRDGEDFPCEDFQDPQPVVRRRVGPRTKELGKDLFPMEPFLVKLNLVCLFEAFSSRALLPSTTEGPCPSLR